MSTNKGAGSGRVIFALAQAVVLGFSVTVGTSLYGLFNPKATSETFCQSNMPSFFPFMFLLPLVVCISVLSQARWQQMPVMTVISAAGWLITNLLREKVVTEIANLCGAFALGCMVNLYSSFTRRSAAEIMLAGVLLQLPAGIAAHGSMVGGLGRADEIFQMTTNQTAQINSSSLGADSIIDLRVPASMARVGIMLALGLRLSSWVAYLLKQRKLNC